MASTEFTSASPQAVKRWSEQLMRESFGKMDIKSLIGKGETACIQLKTELEKDAGDTIKCDLLVQDRSPGTNGDSKLKGNETPLTFFQDEIKINQKRHAHSFKGMSQQRTVHSLRESGRHSLSEWWGWFIEASVLAHAAGVSGDGNESVASALGANTGGTDWAGNQLVALDADHFVDGTAGGFDLSTIDDAVAKAKTNNPRVAPLNIGGQKKYVMYIHPFQTRSLRNSIGNTGWSDIQREANVRGAANPIYTGSLGEYNGVILRESEFVPSTGTVRHAVMFGSGAIALAFGNAWDIGTRGGSGGSFFNWKEEEEDYGNDKGVAGVSVLGIKRCIYNSKTFGVIGVDSTDAPPA